MTEASPTKERILSQVLWEVARRRAPRVVEWSGQSWVVLEEAPGEPGEVVARVAADALADCRPLDGLLALGRPVRLFVTFGSGQDSAPAGRRVAIAWLDAQGAASIHVNDRQGAWASDADLADTAPGALVGFVGFRPKRLVAILHLGDLGGASRAHVQLAAELVQRGHLAHTFTPGWSSRALEQELRAHGVSTSRHSCRWWVGTESEVDVAEGGVGVSQLISELARLAPDVVITETAVIPGGALAARALGIPHIWMIHERVDPDYGLLAPAEPLVMGEAIRALSDQVLVNSSFVGRHFFGPDAELAVAAPISVQEFDSVRSRAEDMAVRESGPFVVAVAGQITEAKGQLDLVDAIGRLAREGRSVVLRVFGSGARHVVDQLRDRVSRLELQPSVVLEGHCDDLMEQLASCDAVAIPSWAEGFGRVAVEAVALGVPVVYVGTGGTAEYMVDGVTGLAVPPRDPEAMARALASLMDDPLLSERLTEQARPHVRRWLAEHDAADAVLAAATRLRPPLSGGGWSDRTISRMVARDAEDVSIRLSTLKAWANVDLASPAAIQGAGIRGERMSRLLWQWLGNRGSPRSLVPRGAAGAAGAVGRALPRRIRVALLVAREDPSLDSLLVERLVDQDWYRQHYSVPEDRDCVIEFARRGIRRGHRPNELVDPEWYLQVNPDVAESGVSPVEHYLLRGCYEGRAPGPRFDPDGYLRENPDVAASALLPLEHYMVYGRAEGRTW